MKKLLIDELDESLRILGHTQLWLRGQQEVGLPDFFEVISADERVLAWWCADSGSWFLNMEVDHITQYAGVPDLPAIREMTEGNLFCLSTKYYFL